MDVKTKEIVDFGAIGQIDDEGRLKFPILYTRDKGGKLRLWQIIIGLVKKQVDATRDDTDGAWLENVVWTPVTNEFINRSELPDGVVAVYYTRTGQEGGAVKITKPTYITEGTNVGKKNYTTVFTNGIRKVMTEYNKKLKDGATPNKDKVTVRGATTDIETLIADTDRGDTPWRVFPMAFHSVEKEANWKHIHFPAIIQPKYDGTRLLVVAHPDIPDGIDNYSRGRETYAADHITEELLPALKKFPGLYLDGELWKKGYGLQDISGSSRRIKDSSSKRPEAILLEYHVFDAFYLDKPMTFIERAEVLDQLFDELSDANYIFRVPNQEVESREEAQEVYEGFLAEGLEGAIIRNEDSPYEVGISKEERTYKTLKMKPRDDAEFEISGYKEGAGKNKGLIIWICLGPKGGKTRKTFTVTPNWPEQKRAEVYTRFEEDPELFSKFIGQEAVIQYATLSKDGLPQQPKFLRFRDTSLDELLL